MTAVRPQKLSEDEIRALSGLKSTDVTTMRDRDLEHHLNRLREHYHHVLDSEWAASSDGEPQIHYVYTLLLHEALVRYGSGGLAHGRIG